MCSLSPKSPLISKTFSSIFPYPDDTKVFPPADAYTFSSGTKEPSRNVDAGAKWSREPVSTIKVPPLFDIYIYINHYKENKNDNEHVNNNNVLVIVMMMMMMMMCLPLVGVPVPSLVAHSLHDYERHLNLYGVHWYILMYLQTL